jgi:hypothetical protein
MAKIITNAVDTGAIMASKDRVQHHAPRSLGLRSADSGTEISSNQRGGKDSER